MLVHIMLNWFKSQWNDVKGNAKWALLGAVWWALTWLANHLLREIPSIPRWVATAVAFVFSAIVFVWLARRATMREGQKPSPGGQALATTPSQFDVDQFFATIYNSPLAKEVEANMRQAVEIRYPQPGEREAFLIRFIGLGVMATFYEIAWAYIFRSQVSLLEALNQKSLRLDEVKPFYDKAALEYPAVYAAYSFDQWLEWLRSQVFILQQGMMVGITVRGKDFLKYLVHWGRSANGRRY